MKIEDLKEGDIVKVRYNSEYPSTDQGQIIRKESRQGELYFTVKTRTSGLVGITKGYITAKLEPQPLQYKEVPIEKPKSWKFNSTLYKGFRSTYFAGFDLPYDFDLSKTYSVEIKEII